MKSEEDRSVVPVVCTYNRSDDAIACINRLMDCSPDEAIRVVLVDSLSDQYHAEALEQYSMKYPSITLIRAESPGLSVARNCAIGATTAAWLAFLDDDARPDAGWWETAQIIAQRVSEDVAIVGGRIIPRWPGNRPAHIGKRWLTFLSCIEEFEQENTNGVPECYGANLMVRRSALKQVGGFPTQLGRVGSTLLSGEENLVQHLLRQQGLMAVYDGKLVVEHIIEPERLTLQWIRRRAFWGGVTAVVTARIMNTRPPHLNLVKALGAACILRLMRLTGDPDSDLLIRAHYANGVIAGWWWTSFLRKKIDSSGIGSVDA